MVGLDEVQRRVTLQVSGQHDCGAACDHTDRLFFFSLRSNQGATAAGPPPSATMDLPPTNLLATQKLDLPIGGEPNRYPFDVYELRLGITLGRVQPDGSVAPYPPDSAAAGLVLTVQEQLPREEMAPPRALDPAALPAGPAPYPYLTVASLTFARPLFLQVLTILLVLLIGAAAVYAVFMRPLPELIINVGGVILGVWGIPGDFDAEQLRASDSGGFVLVDGDPLPAERDYRAHARLVPRARGRAAPLSPEEWWHAPSERTGEPV